MLKINTVSKHFGGVKAVDNLDLQVESGEIYGLIGPNGSGKSTLVNVVCGVLKPTAGDVIFEGRSMAGQTPSTRLRNGIARTFQNIRLFGGLTVWQNLWVARNSTEDIRSQSILRRWLGSGTALKKEIETMLEFSNLADKADVLASNLAFGEQRRLELARAVAAKPRLLLLDEPTAALDLGGREALVATLADLAADPSTPPMVQVTHHVEEIPPGFTHALLLEAGRVVNAGPLADVVTEQALSSCYGLDLRLTQAAGRWAVRVNGSGR